MTPDQKAKAGRILGYICVVAGALNLAIAGILVLQDQTQIRFPLLGSGAGALTIGMIILARGRREPTSGD